MACSNDGLRMVLLGKTGSGKSTTGNTILGREAFKVDLSPGSVTKKSEKQEGIVEGRRVSVIDTPGPFSTSLTQEELTTEVIRCLSLSSPGPHMFLLVIRLGVRFTEEEWNNVRWIQENFGKEALKKYTVVLYLGEPKGQSMDFTNHCSELENFVSNISDKYFVLGKNNYSQVTKLMELIEDNVMKNGGQQYAPKMFYKAQEKLEGLEQMKQKEIDKRNMHKQRIKTAIIIGCGMIFRYAWTATQNYFNIANEIKELCILIKDPHVIIYNLL